jgi:integration host factor subunit beta
LQDSSGNQGDTPGFTRDCAGISPYLAVIKTVLDAGTYFRWNKAMTKADLIEEVSRLAELTRKDSEIIVETIFDSVVRSLRSGDKIEIRGFGSFRTRQRKPRVGRNPKTGARVEVPAKKIPYFKPSKELKDVINHGKTAEAAAAAPTAEGPTS